MDWVVWSCLGCRKLRYGIEWWAQQGWCHHGVRIRYGEGGGNALTIPLGFNPTEEVWYGKPLPRTVDPDPRIRFHPWPDYKKGGKEWKRPT